MQSTTSERILTSAHSWMSRIGYAAFSYADISDSVKIRKASIHHHFPTKADLAVAVLRRHREGLIKGADALNTAIDNPFLRLEAYTQYWENCLRDQTQPFCVAALLAAELPGLPDEVAAELKLHFLALKEWIMETLEEGVQKGSIHLHSNPDVEADAFIAVVHGALLAARVSGNSETFQQITASALKKFSTR